MRNMKFTILLLAALLALLPVASLARATSESDSLRNRSNARLTTAPIGSASSLDTIEINGTTAGRQGLLWNGDIIQAAPGAAVQVSLAAVGQLTLRGGSSVRLAADTTSRVLLATVVNGEVN